jgi:hypothetical protein
MSREERRNYQRMMRDVERTPSLPPAAKARAERSAARRAARSATAGGEGGATTLGFTLRWWITSILLAALIGYFGFSFQWDSGMPFAAYFGLATGVVALGLLAVLRFAQRTAANR